ncbi:MAG: TetR/AcrR family transcriptional regulator [Deltaproteobacteria bacterium]|nr:MAG: TetR/AcrR family transcriptional regulator [Deltaproteobacteria bacterium]
MPRRPRSRDASKRGTREALLHAGMAEFAAHGLDAPSLDAICARAGYTRGAFYVHFKDRDDFIVGVMERVLGPFLDAVIATGDQARDLERTVRRYVESIGQIGPPPRRTGRRSPRVAGTGVPFHRLLEACARSERIRGRFVALLQEAIERVAKAAGAGQAAGSVRSDVDAEALATLLVAAALGAATALEIGLPFEPERVRSAVLDLIGG